MKAHIDGDVRPGQIHYTGKMLCVGNLSTFDLVGWVRKVQEQAAETLRATGAIRPRHGITCAAPVPRASAEISKRPPRGAASPTTGGRRTCSCDKPANRCADTIG